MPSGSHEQQPPPFVSDTKMNGEFPLALTSDEVRGGTTVVMSHPQRQAFLKTSRLGEVFGIAELLPEVGNLTERLMTEFFVASEAVRLLRFFLEQTAVGGLQRVSGDAFASLLQKLKGFLDYKLVGRPELDQACEQPQVLESVIVEEARKDQEFQNKLEELVKQLQQAEKDSHLSQPTRHTRL